VKKAQKIDMDKSVKTPSANPPINNDSTGIDLGR
jgi:hypothetical protein